MKSDLKIKRQVMHERAHNSYSKYKKQNKSNTTIQSDDGMHRVSLNVGGYLQ